MSAIRLRDLQEQREAILAIAASHGATNVRVFGSVARDEARQESDIDFLVEMSPEHSPWFPSGLRLDLAHLLERNVDVVTEQMLDREIRAAALHEAIPL